MLLRKNVETKNIVESVDTLIEIAKAINSLTIDKVAGPLHIQVMICTPEEYECVLNKIRNGE